MVGAAAYTPDSHEVEERQLVDGLRRGDEASFELLVSRYGARLLATARRLLANEDDACDAVQDAFVSAFKNIGSFHGNSRISTWLHRIVVNAALSKLRSRKQKHEVSIDDLLPRFLQDGHPVNPAAEWRESAEAALDRVETRYLVRRTIDQLPETYRTVLVLRDIEELDTLHVAGLLGVTTGVVKVRLHRARQALRGLLDSHFRRGDL